MTIRLYFDTSALLKEFVQEIGSDLVDKAVSAARQSRIQIVTSVWSINETIAVVDRLSRRPQNPISQAEKQQIIAALAERVKSSGQYASYRLASIDHAIVAGSRVLIDKLHISPDDALHVYTAFIFDCEFFLVHDGRLVSRLKGDPIEGMKVIDLADTNDRRLLESRLAL